MKARIATHLFMLIATVAFVGCATDLISYMEGEIRNGGGTDYHRFLDDPGFCVDGPAVLDSRDSPPSTQMERGAPTNGVDSNTSNITPELKRIPLSRYPCLDFRLAPSFVLAKSRGCRDPPF